MKLFTTIKNYAPLGLFLWNCLGILFIAVSICFIIWSELTIFIYKIVFVFVICILSSNILAKIFIDFFHDSNK